MKRRRENGFYIYSNLDDEFLDSNCVEYRYISDKGNSHVTPR